jgi:hypothetical protein
MKKGRILISLSERSEYIVNIEVYLDNGADMQILETFEILKDNVVEKLDSLAALVSGYTVTVILSAYEEKYKKISFSNIGTINVSKNLKKTIKRFEEDYQVVHSLLINKPNEIITSWNFILVLVPFHKITDQILVAFIDKRIKVKKIYLYSLANLDIINKILNAAPIKMEAGKIFVNIAASQIGRYLHTVVFVNNYIYDISRHVLANLKDNADETIFQITNIKNTMLLSEIDKSKKIEYQYILLNDNNKLKQVLFEKSSDVFEFFHKKLSLSESLEDTKSITNLATVRLKLLATKLLHFARLDRLSKIGFIFNKLLIGMLITFVVFSAYAVFVINRSHIALRSLAKEESNDAQKLLSEELEQQEKIKNLNNNSKIIFYNLKNNKYPLELLNVIKKVTEYQLVITNIKYIQSVDEKKLVLDIHIPKELSSRNRALDKITDFFQYLKLNLPAHNEIRFYRDTILEEKKEIIPVQIVILDKKI